MLRRTHYALVIISLISAITACQEPVLNPSQSDLGQNSSASPANSANLTNSNQASLGGLIRERDTGKFISGASVRLDTRSTSSDQAGFYQFMNPGSGEVKLIVMHPNFATYTETLTLDSQRRIHDVQLSPLGTAPSASPDAQSSPNISPSSSPTPIILLPDGSVSSPSPSASASASASPQASPSPSSTSSSASATPSPSPSPAWDPKLDDATQAQVLVKRRSNGLELVFLLAQNNGGPVNWEWGQVKVEYFIGKTSGPNTESLVTSGRTVINAYGEGFVVVTSQAQGLDSVRVKFTLTLPDNRLIENEMLVQVSS